MSRLIALLTVDGALFISCNVFHCCGMMDPTKAIRLSVRVGAYMSKPDRDRTEYCQAKWAQKVIERGNFKMGDLIAMLRSEFKWGSRQYLCVSFWNEFLGEHIDLSSDADLDSTLALEKKRRVLLNVQVMDVAPCWEGVPLLGMEVSQPDCSTVDNLAKDPCSQASNELQQALVLSLSEPQIEPAPTSEPNNVSEANSVSEQDTESEQDIESEPNNDPQSEEEDHVGVDDEGMYNPSDPDDNVSEYDPAEDEEQLEEEVNDEALLEPLPVTDLNNPVIQVDSIFADQSTFKRALRHYAILNEFEYNVDYSEQKRFGASCTHPDCNWRIHASRLQDDRTYKVVHFIVLKTFCHNFG